MVVHSLSVAQPMYLQTPFRQTSVVAHCASISHGKMQVPMLFSMLHLASRGSCVGVVVVVRACSTHSRSERQPTYVHLPDWQASNNAHCVSLLHAGPQCPAMHSSSLQSALVRHWLHLPPVQYGFVVVHWISEEQVVSVTQRSSVQV